MTVHEEVDKHRPDSHHHKDNNGFRRETEMSSRHTQPFVEAKHKNHADWHMPARKKMERFYNGSPSNRSSVAAQGVLYLTRG